MFIHLAKTGGSSIWMSLVATAASLTPPVPVIDLYHNSRVAHGTVTDVHKVLEHFREVIRENRRVLLHHHTAYPIHSFLDRPPVYTTIVRDPVGRFISELNHARALLRGDEDALHQEGAISPIVEMEGRGWPRHLIDAAISNDVSFAEFAKSALQETSFRRFYYWNFYHLLLGRSDVLVPQALPADSPSDEDLAQLARAHFAFIGRFPFVFKSYLRIAQIYGMPVPITADIFPHLLRRGSPDVTPELQEEIKSAFAKEYAFLSALGFDF